MLRTPRALWRLACALGYVLRGALLCGLVFPFVARPRRMAMVGRWCVGMLRAMGITVQVSGTPHPGPVLLVANHVSWLDILAVNAVHTARFVSKADVRHWPVIGWLVASGGTLFIERERKRDAMRVVHQVAAALEDGDVIAMFPEGTTSDGHGLLPFHANLLQAAVVTGVPMQPMAVRFSDAHEPISSAAAYIGEMTLVQSLWLIVRADQLRVDVALLAPHPSTGLDRRALSEAARVAIASRLGIATTEAA